MCVVLKILMMIVILDWCKSGQITTYIFTKENSFFVKIIIKKKNEWLLDNKLKMITKICYLDCELTVRQRKISL